MLRKLIKYEILADYKKYGIMGIAVIALAVLALISEKTAPPYVNGYSNFISAVFAISSVFTIFSASILLIVLSTIRFYKSFLKDEGYLMHTLPVHTWQLIASKLIAAYIWFLFLLIISAVYVTILNGNITWITDFSVSFIDGFSEENYYLNQLIISSLISVLLTPFSYLAHIYFSFALGNLFSKNKLTMSVVMFLAINFAERVITSVLLSAYLTSVKDDTALTAMTYSNTFLSVILSVIYLIAAERIFAKKLNLE